MNAYRAPVAWTQLPLPTAQAVATEPHTAPPSTPPAPVFDDRGRVLLERDQPLPMADDLATAAPRHERGHVVAVAVTLVSPHADTWRLTARPLYGHAQAWRNTLKRLATLGRTRAYDARTPRRCTWDSADGGPPQ